MSWWWKAVGVGVGRAREAERNFNYAKSEELFEMEEGRDAIYPATALDAHPRQLLPRGDVPAGGAAPVDLPHARGKSPGGVNGGPPGAAKTHFAGKFSAAGQGRMEVYPAIWSSVGRGGFGWRASRAAPLGQRPRVMSWLPRGLMLSPGGKF